MDGYDFDILLMLLDDDLFPVEDDVDTEEMEGGVIHVPK